MTRIYQQSSSRQQRWYESGIRYVQGAKSAVCLFAALALLASFAAAQSASQLNGNVSDPSGATVSGAKIVLTDTATGLQRTTTSNSAGLYQFLDVPPGNYKLEASASGFSPYLAAKVTLVVNTPSTINIKFRVAGIET
ncbi:MAG TPA: carboxypeptidase-like regulatory domain-containing protein, partial [Candidatus Sulfotelmatobacter sp.]|nr:carboxypeptidase-like regulatory domain-containing protein [Candidatus Sulfotelmatobacter sp.]